MTTTDTSPTTTDTSTTHRRGTTVIAPPSRRSAWIEHWDPEDHAFWQGGGRTVARRNLVPSILAEFLGFAVWASWSIVVPQLGAAGFDLTVDQQYWLVAVPALVGATLRIPYTFAVPRFGGRNWTVVSALLLLLPASALAVVASRPATPFAVLLVVAALAGLGGGNFASSMANISFFYPEREKGRALGLNAAGGNLGTAFVQLVVPVVVVAGGGLALERAGLMFLPLVLGAAVLACRRMSNLTGARADYRAFGAATRNRHTWVISFLYIGTFGSFIGYAGAFPTLLAGQFPQVGMSLAFLGALVGSLARPAGGALADRWGGAPVTIASFLVMAAGAAGAVAALSSRDVGLFLGSFLVLFVASGAGNGATYRMIPAVFQVGATTPERAAAARKAAAGCLGIAGAAGAFGGFLIPRGFAVSTTVAGSLVPALWVFVGMYAVTAATTWAVYRRPSAALSAARI
ncbi:MFS transporter [Actinotalea fermentans]|uniref:MFS transporter n=1 Tax=Actinotalea fermentans TaxID=43671 RepID=A0A511YUC5_9CELL|nr:MFS transporter [Actinotalea fermentans]KGM15239.1 nitrate transporter [Actinotalea fermentans ATCC 43279 = JCM 9966 = DSM 3133]GEN78798.1 MFS transporter [Actinotalea fermentans]